MSHIEWLCDVVNTTYRVVLSRVELRQRHYPYTPPQGRENFGLGSGYHPAESAVFANGAAITAALTNYNR